MNLLEKAIIIATKAHDGQKDKAGQPYILHPLRVMLHCKTSTERIVAVLHDVMEDANYTRAQLEAENISKTVLDALEILTKHNQEHYGEYITRICSNPLATQIKLYDLQDNLDVSRLSKITEKDRARIAKYSKAKNQLLMAQRA